MNCLSLLGSLISDPDGGDTLDVGEGKGRLVGSSSILYFLFLISVIVLLLTMLLLLLIFLECMAGDSGSLLVGGEGGELAGGELAAHAMGINPGWKKAGFPDIDKPEAAIS